MDMVQFAVGRYQEIAWRNAIFVLKPPFKMQRHAVLG